MAGDEHTTINFLELVQAHGALVIVLVVAVLVFSSLMEVARHKVEHLFRVYHHPHLNKVMDTLFSELAVLGLISFAMFLATGHDQKASQIALFESVHMLLFLILLFYLTTFFGMMVFSFYLPLRRWRAWEMVDYDVAKEAYDELEARNAARNWCDRLCRRIYARSDERIRQCYLFHAVRRSFLQRHDLLDATAMKCTDTEEDGFFFITGPQFAFSNYLKNMMCNVFIDLISFGWSLWSIVLLMVTLLMLTEDDLTIYIFAFATALPIIGLILHYKWRSAFYRLGADVQTYLGNQGAEADALIAEAPHATLPFFSVPRPWTSPSAHDSLFWFGSPFVMQKFTKAIIYAESVFLALAILIIPDADSEVRLDAEFVLPLNLLCFLLVIYLAMGEDIPTMTLLTSVGKYTRLSVVSEVIQAYKPEPNEDEFVSDFHRPMVDLQAEGGSPSSPRILPPI